MDGSRFSVFFTESDTWRLPLYEHKQQQELGFKVVGLTTLKNLRIRKWRFCKNGHDFEGDDGFLLKSMIYQIQK